MNQLSHVRVNVVRADKRIAALGERWMKSQGLTGAYRPHPTGGDVAAINTKHPDLGRQLRIEYQDWTPKGGYRHPRWDRWENE